MHFSIKVMLMFITLITAGIVYCSPDFDKLLEEFKKLKEDYGKQEQKISND